MHTRPRVLVLAIILGCLLLLASCGGDTKSTPAPTPVVSVSINPTTSNISVTQTAQFSATVTGSTNTAVTWSASAGTVTNGLFTPPLQAGSYKVTATSQADTTKSASATITVTAPAAQFSSAPVTAASEGTEYTYTVVAEDPAGTAVTYELTTKPAGATIEGGAITWTPTAEQARVANVFTVKATTAAGGSATQTWTVTPNGTIRITYVDKFWTADGNSTDDPVNMSGWNIYALVPQEDGSVTELSGTGNEDGTFTIPDVPAGYYWLAFGWGEIYWTDSSTFDYGSDYTGRLWDGSNSVNTTFAFDVFALNPQRECCYGLDFVSPNANVYLNTDIVNPDSTVFSNTIGPYTVAPIDPAKGDTSYVLQWDRVDRTSAMALKTYVNAVTSGLALDSLATVPDGITHVEGHMSATPKAFNLNVKGSEWTKALITSGPGLSEISPFFAGLSVVPFVTDKYTYTPYYDSLDLAYMDAVVTSIDQDLGTFRYVNPYPATWKTAFAAEQYARIPVYVPGSTKPAYLENDVAFITDNIPTGPIAPIMSNVTNPKINGKDFFAVNTTDGSAVIVSWEVPSGLAPFGYEVGVHEVYDEGDYSYAENWFDLYTSGTSVTIPQDFFAPGTSYVFTIRAMADARASVKTSPWRSKLPIADARIVSGPMTIEGSVEPTIARSLKAMKKAAVSKMPADLAARVKARKLRSFSKIKRREQKQTK
ncbi:MAG TPA: putative Ig domain-containing protein [Terriglobales bacterium]|nr:putative Ig domain-containing protein [Terriglobales bacterium]